MARKESGTVRPTKRKRVFFAAAVLLLVGVLAAGAVSAETTVFVGSANFTDVIKDDTDPTRILIITEDIELNTGWSTPLGGNITLTTEKNKNYTISWKGSPGSNSMFTVPNGKYLTIIGNGTGTLTLDGSNSRGSQNLVKIGSGGYFTLKMGGVLANNTAANGGAVYVDGGTFTMKGGSIVNNTATDGGAVYMNGGTFTMSGNAAISYNTAKNDIQNDKGNGGAVYMNGGTFTMSGNATISYNKATTHGGAVSVESGTFTMERGTITNNTATTGGGAVYVNSSKSAFTMSGGKISGNEASGNGGGVFVYNAGNFSLSEGMIDNNKATNGGGVSVENSDNVTISGGTITNNKANNGGGVFMKGTNTQITMEEGTITGNTADSKDSVTSTWHGGGVHIDEGTFTMSGGTISGNTAKENGGGVYVHFGGTFVMSGGEITGNKADTNGTSVYVGGIFNIQDSGTVNGVYLPKDKNITVTGALDGATKVTGIIPANPAKDLLVVDLDTVGMDYLSKFTLDGSVKNFALKYQQDEPKRLVLTPTHTVTFEAYGGTPVPEDQTIEHNTCAKEPDEPTRDDHTFKGWHADPTFQTPWNFDTDTVTYDRTLYAKWIPNEPGPGPEPQPPSGGSSGDGNMDNAYRVLFNDGATTLYVVTDLSAGDKLTKPEDPVKDGYTFAGWHKDSACTQAWDFNDGITGDMTLYAKWTPQETVTPTATATATQTAEPTGEASPAPTVQPDNNGNNGDTTNGETTTTPGISLPYLIGGILILLLAILLLLILLLRHTVTFLIPTGGEITEHRIKVWHGRYINTEDLPALIRTAAWYRDPARQERWDFDQDRVKKSIELYLG